MDLQIGDRRTFGNAFDRKGFDFLTDRIRLQSVAARISRSGLDRVAVRIDLDSRKVLALGDIRKDQVLAAYAVGERQRLGLEAGTTGCHAQARFGRSTCRLIWFICTALLVWPCLLQRKEQRVVDVLHPGRAFDFGGGLYDVDPFSDILIMDPNHVGPDIVVDRRVVLRRVFPGLNIHVGSRNILQRDRAELLPLGIGKVFVQLPNTECLVRNVYKICVPLRYAVDDLDALQPDVAAFIFQIRFFRIDPQTEVYGHVDVFLESFRCIHDLLDHYGFYREQVEVVLEFARLNAVLNADGEDVLLFIDVGGAFGEVSAFAFADALIIRIYRVIAGSRHIQREGAVPLRHLLEFLRFSGRVVCNDNRL